MKLMESAITAVLDAPVESNRSGSGASGEVTSRKRLILLAHVGMDNLGDELLFASAVRFARCRSPSPPVRALTMNPADTLARHGVEADAVRPPNLPDDSVPSLYKPLRAVAALRRLGALCLHELTFTARSAKLLRSGDVILVTGSSQLIEAYGGAWGFPLTLFRWTALARLRGARIAFLSVGAEDVHGAMSRRLLRWTARMATYISVRDQASLDRLRTIGVRRSIPLIPDLVLGLDPGVPRRVRSAGERGTLAINLVPYYSSEYWRESDPARWESYLAAATAFSANALDRGHDLVFYGTTEWADRIAADEVVSRLRGMYGAEIDERIRQPVVRSFNDLWAVLTAADWVIASRYHGAVTALVARRPVLALCYERKTADLMEIVALGRYAIDLETMDADRVIAALTSLEDEASEVTETMHGEVSNAADAVLKQYQAILEQGARA